FVDDFLIEQMSLERTFHRAEYHPASPILRPDTPWEKRDEAADRTNTPPNPAAMVFSDGVFYDPQARLFKMWYMGGYSQHTCYACSADGVAWQKPSLDVVPGTNITTSGNRDSSTVWLDLNERDPSRRYKLAFWHDHYMQRFLSPDGIHWREIARTGTTGDRSTFFFNPFLNAWGFSLRGEAAGSGRAGYGRYGETGDWGGPTGGADEPVNWIAADGADPRRPELNVPVEIYNLDCVAYESLVLGLFTMFRGERTEREKPND